MKDEDAATAKKEMAARNPKENVVMVEACNDGPRWGDARRIGYGVEKQWRNDLLGIGWSKRWSELRRSNWMVQLRKKVRAINKDEDGEEGF
ncbi:hypothetical protein Golob_016985 [Gossypium lobatum]|uniref:Uncharacterized protein n=1 Tax=Gossypium lobatum TaxID=34289 RepID=A0A7J8M616_9ROSI|nr:hypothetical protein [Gossypium lobatum]